MTHDRGPMIDMCFYKVLSFFSSRSTPRHTTRGVHVVCRSLLSAGGISSNRATHECIAGGGLERGRIRLNDCDRDCLEHRKE